jgi:hypothetical protein
VAVLHLFVSKDGLVVGAPVDDRRLSVRVAGLEEPQEEPLCPAVVLGLVRRELARPVDGPAHAFHLSADPFDVALDDLARMLTFLDRSVLRGQSERVVAHRAQHLRAPAAVEAREDVAERVRKDVPHVQRARRVRQHLEHVGLPLVTRRPRLGIRHLEGAVLLPGPLPLRLDCLRVVLVHDRPPKNEKASRVRGRGELTRPSPRWLPSLQKQLLHLFRIVAAVQSKL